MSPITPPWGNHLHQHPLWPGRAEQGTHRGTGPGMAVEHTGRKSSICHSPIIWLLVRGGECRLSWMGGWHGSVDGPHCHFPMHQPDSTAWRATKAAWLGARNPASSPQFHHPIPLSPLAPCQPPPSDASRAVTALSHHGRAGDS